MHEKRLSRKLGKALEELVAEMGGAILCHEVGIKKSIKNQAAYIQSWLKEFNNNDRMVMTASSVAEKAVDYILNS